MEAFMNQIKQLASLQSIGKTYVRPGVIQSYDPKTYRVRVSLPPDDVWTGWILLSSWGEVMPPEIGTQCLVVFLNGDVNHGIVINNLYSDEKPPPQDSEVTKPGSYLLKTKNGTTIKITNDGAIKIKSPAGQTISMDSDTKIQIGTSSEAYKRLVKETIKDLYNNHIHVLGGPPPLVGYHITDSDLTNVLEGN